MGERAPSLYRRESGRNCAGIYIGFPHSTDGKIGVGEPTFRILFLAGLAVALCQARWLPRNAMEALMAS